MTRFRFRPLLVAAVLSLAPLAAGAQQILVNTPPPAPIAENPPPAPSPGQVWVGGYWSWNGSQYAWTAGHWEAPPQPQQTWEAPQWTNEGGRYRFRAGQWRHREGGGMGGPMMNGQPMGGPPPMAVPVQVAPPPPPPPSGPIQVTIAPPRMRFERRSPMQAPGQTWVPGFWSWNGSAHTWTAGHWEAPPRQRARWIQPQWVRRGRQWVFMPGAWR